MDLDNFDEYPGLEDARSNIESIMRAVAGNFAGGTSVSVESVPWKPVDGFIPFTRGGLAASFLVPLSEETALSFDRMGIKDEAIARIRRLEENEFLDGVRDFVIETEGDSSPFVQKLDACGDREKALELAGEISGHFQDEGIDEYLQDRQPFLKVEARILYNPDWEEKYGADATASVSVNFDYPYFREAGDYAASVGSQAARAGSSVETLAETDFSLPDNPPELGREMLEVARRAFPDYACLEESAQNAPALR